MGHGTALPSDGRRGYAAVHGDPGVGADGALLPRQLPRLGPAHPRREDAAGLRSRWPTDAASRGAASQARHAMRQLLLSLLPASEFV